MGVAEFASLPDWDGEPARMMLLVPEPGGERLFVNDLSGPLCSVSEDGRDVVPYLDLGSPRRGLDFFNEGCKGFQSFAFHPQFNIRSTPG